MKKLYLFLIVFVIHKSYSQIQSSIVDIKLDEIKDISYRMKSNFPKNHTAFYLKTILDFNDSALTYIINLDTSVIPLLIERIVDTTLTSVRKPNSEQFFRRGDLAIVLISYIEFMPFAILIPDQWCTCCDGGYIPNGFLRSVETNRIRFQNSYKEYYYSARRGESIKENKRYLKKYMRTKDKTR